ncbi:MAG: pyrroline-5-carboxylate reductase [Candidatus Omnitrophica bacterium]|nr:pyrroline-5-carboxylate reductase [Candidatus Omnitrophota bacterium]
MKKKFLGIIGAGNMGEAIINGLSKNRNFKIGVCEKNLLRQSDVLKRYAVRKIKLEELTKACDIIIICVKPQDIDSVFKDLSGRLSRRQLVISIAAGISTAYMEKFLGPKTALIRVMPNMPGLIGKGVSVYCSGKYAASSDEKITELIFKPMGEILRVSEAKMDAVTALSGSGPGFIAYLADAFIMAAQKIGLTGQEGRFLYMQTLAGTLALLSEGKISPEILVKKVASKGGTTQAGLEVFKRSKIAKGIERALKAAKKRAKELNKK